MTARQNGSYGYQVDYVPERKENEKTQGNKKLVGWISLRKGHFLKQPLLIKTEHSARRVEDPRGKAQIKEAVLEIFVMNIGTVGPEKSVNY